MANLLLSSLLLFLGTVTVQGQFRQAAPPGNTPIFVQGPPGALGQAGLPGPPGERGYFGVPGRAGGTGEKGEKGEPGHDALPGQRGAKGDQGMKGALGPSGPGGDIGITGDKGEQGDRGLPGLPGYQGEKGDRGDSGWRGPQGPPGVAGASIIGPKGDKGDLGISGQDGWPGDAGPIGPPGPPGPTGQPGNGGADCGRNTTRSFSASVTTPPHFYARLIGVITRIPPNKITFGDVIANYGGTYDPNTGIFQPPINGVYNVMVSIAPFKGTVASAVLKRLPASNYTVEPETIRTFTVGSSAAGTWLPYSTDILLQLTQNDQLWIEAVRTPIMPNNTHFGAFLLHTIINVSS